MPYKNIRGYDFLKPPDDIKVIKLTEEDIDTYAKSQWDKPGEYVIAINNQVLCYNRQYKTSSERQPHLFRFDLEEAASVAQALRRLDQPYPYDVFKFDYDGFNGNVDEDHIMHYRAGFLGWTGESGIGMFECSDGKIRAIPTFAIKHGKEILPNDTTVVDTIDLAVKVMKAAGVMENIIPKEMAAG